MTGLLEGGVVALALTVALVSVEVVKRFIDRRRNGNGNGGNGEVIVECPNKIDSLAATLIAIGKVLDKLDSHVRVLNERTGKTREGVMWLVGEHKAGPDGVQHWKILPQHDDIWKQMVKNQESSQKLQATIVRLLEDKHRKT